MQTTKAPRSLISAFVVRCLDSIISLDSIAEISRLFLASVAEQAGLCLTRSETPEDTFCHDEAQLYDTRTCKHRKIIKSSCAFMFVFFKKA